MELNEKRKIEKREWVGNWITVRLHQVLSLKLIYAQRI